MSTAVSIKELLEAGAHFGHQVSRWNPRMRPFIFSIKSGVHVLDLEQTVEALKRACKFVTDTVALGHSVLFVGTKTQAKPVIEEEAKRCGQFYVNYRWLGGLLTNFKTIRASIERLKNLEKLAGSEEFQKYTKKERLDVEREIHKLNNIFLGIKTMEKMPGVIFLIDPKTESIAKKEGIRLKIPLVAIVDTNCDPEGIDYVIPANDDAIRSIQLITKAIADACEEGSKKREERLLKESRTDKGDEKPSVVAREMEVKEKAKAYVGRKKKGEEDTEEESDPEKYAKSTDSTLVR